MEYSLKLTEEEIRIIVNALFNRPYGEVAKLINSIEKQITKTED